MTLEPGSLALYIRIQTDFLRVGRRRCPACRNIRVVYDLRVTARVFDGFDDSRSTRRCAPCHGIR